MPAVSQLKVLVVDDTSVSRALIFDALDQIGIKNVQMAKDGEAALKTMMTKPSHLVISDFNMPKLDGLGLLKALRQYKPTSRVGFILVTGRKDSSLIMQGQKLGMNNYIAKPFDVPKFKASIEAVVGKLTN